MKKKCTALLGVISDSHTDDFAKAAALEAARNQGCFNPNRPVSEARPDPSRADIEKAFYCLHLFRKRTRAFAETSKDLIEALRASNVDQNLKDELLDKLNNEEKLNDKRVSQLEGFVFALQTQDNTSKLQVVSKKHFDDDSKLCHDEYTKWTALPTSMQCILALPAGVASDQQTYCLQHDSSEVARRTIKKCAPLRAAEKECEAVASSQSGP